MSRSAPAVVERVFQPDHPASRGHFAGNPIIPGAVLLSEAISAIEAGLEAKRPIPFVITSAKFLNPARPGDRVLIEYSCDDRDEVRFTCTVEGRTVLTGRICRAQPAAR